MLARVHHARRIRLAASRTLCASASSHLELPVLRLPTTIFPHHPLSLPVLSPPPHARPLAGALRPAFADECNGTEIALLADGATTGVVARIPDTDTPAADGMLLHVLGGRRITLLETLHRSPAGGRFARFAPLDDAPLDSATEERALVDEGAVLHALLDSHRNAFVQPDDFELLLCTLDEELTILPADADPTSHPLWLSASKTPDDPLALGWWLAARLPLTTSLRLHLLSCTCPLKRTRDLVDAMRLLQQPAVTYAATKARKFAITWQTAEASGCELAPPRPVVDWADGHELSRY